MKKAFVITAAVIPFALQCSTVSAVCCDKIGYGQGKSVNAENCPTGAEEFNSKYNCYDAYATTTDKSRIILTFDQGYENGFTESILNTLKEKNVKAIFFLTGDYAKKEEALVKRMIAEGHIIGNHGMTHSSLPELDTQQLKEEVMSLHNFVLEKYGYEMQYLRPPCGEYSEQALSDIKDLGYKTLMWSFAYVDWNTDSQPSQSEALEKMTNSAHGGGIYLLHSVSSTNAAVLGQAVDNLRAQGFIL